MIVRMWEARAEAYGVADLITWVCDTALPEVEHDPLHVSSEVFSSTDHRVVVISKWRSNPRPLPEPPALLVARAPHSWDFTQVDR
ncbi:MULTISPECIES: hypothetical protein [unclassified Micromonospora]|uniref:hypothetical protein n=1 Tax=unclassified Micromonospora TaxID=2617518 RepID=UPI000EF53C6B|nr:MULTISPECIES: hypothetical protein [unclassified Micromonospora]RLP85006.1 hypothetical protein EAD89_25390 [Micromonospora sp. BL4]RLP96229.1 hypothetical protein EAD98_11170 [Micromonospora sp. CV4]